MKKCSVFISSVMRDFSEERLAAKAAVESLHQVPIMAEDFGAKPYSSQMACLEGVRKSDVYVGIFGERYGYVASSGISVTEEEFQEARRRGLTILCFVQDGPKEHEQAEFLSRLKDYEEGYFIATFKTSQQLQTEIVRALFGVIGQPDVVTLDMKGAISHLNQYNWGSRKEPDYGTWLGVVVFSARQGEEYVSLTDLGQRSFQDTLLQPALFGSSAVLRNDRGAAREEKEEHLAFKQFDEHRQLSAILEVHQDGTLVYACALDAEDRRGFSLVRTHVIDQDEVQRAITSFIAYANHFFGQLADGSLISSLYLGVSLTGIRQKMFGRLPKAEINSMVIPTHQLDDPLHIPQQPLKVSRAEITNPEALGQKITDLIGRAFRVAEAYYTPGDK